MVERDLNLLNALDDCITRMRAGQSLEECLRHYPHFAVQLRPMLETGMLVRRARASASEVATAKDRVRFYLRQHTRRRPHPFPLARLAAVIALVFLFGFGGLVAGGVIPLRPNDTAPTATLTSTSAHTATPSVTPTATPGVTNTPSATASATPSATPTPSATYSRTPTATNTPTYTPSATLTQTLRPRPRATTLPNQAPINPGGGGGQSGSDDDDDDNSGKGSDDDDDHSGEGGGDDDDD